MSKVAGQTEYLIGILVGIVSQRAAAGSFIRSRKLLAEREVAVGLVVVALVNYRNA